MNRTPGFIPADTNHCSICCKPLNVHQTIRGGTCDSPGCRHTQLRRQLLAKHEREQALLEQAAGLCRRMIASNGFNTQDILPLAILPSNESVVVNIPEKRRRLFRNRLMGVISTAAAKLAGPNRNAPHNDDEQIVASKVNSPQLLGLLAQGCATCRGDC